MDTDVLIVGGGPAGFTCARSAANTYRNKRITLVREDKNAVIPCGIPYVISSLEQVEHNILPDKGLQDVNVNIVIDTVKDIKGKTAILESGEEISFDKLVLATGSSPKKSPVPGSRLDGVLNVDKSFSFLGVLKERIHAARNICIIGGGFISLEIADEVIKLNKNVSVFCRSCILRSAFDPDFCDLAIKEMESLGAKVHNGLDVKEIRGDGKSVTHVVLTNGEVREADLVISAIGYVANIELGKKLGLEIQNGCISTDEYMRTSKPDIFAIGDCATKREYFSRVLLNVMLASTAMAEGRLAGSNLYELNLIRGVKGTLSTFSTHLGNLSLGATGLTEKQAKAIGFNYVIGNAAAPDRHPGKFKDATNVRVKLLFSANSHTLLGAQVAGGKSVGEMINVLSVMIQKGFTDTEMDTLQLGTHPLLTASPVAYPIIIASGDALMKSGWGKTIAPAV